MRAYRVCTVYRVWGACRVNKVHSRVYRIYYRRLTNLELGFAEFDLGFRASRFRCEG